MLSLGFTMRDEFDTARIREADNRAADAIRTAMRDPRGGYLQKIGREALGGSREQAFAQLDENLRLIDESLTSPAQRQKFQLALQQRMIDAHAAADEHESTQLRVYTIGETKASIENWASDITDGVYGDYTSPTFQAAYQTLLHTTDELVALEGGGEEEARNARMKVSTELHTRVIDRYLQDGRGSEAADYFALVRDSMTPQGQDPVARAVARASQKDTAVRLANQFMPAVELPLPEKWDRQSMVNFALLQSATQVQRYGNAVRAAEEAFTAGKINAATREEVLSVLKANNDRALDLRAQWRDQVGAEARRVLQADPRLTVEGLPDSLYASAAQLDLLPALNSFAENRRDVTDPKALSLVDGASKEALRLVSKDQWRDFFVGRLNRTDMNYALSRWEDANNPENSDYRHFLTVRDRFRAFARNPLVGVLTDSTNDAARRQEEANFDVLTQRLDDHFLRWQEANKRKPTDLEVQAELDKLLADPVYYNPPGWAGETRVARFRMAWEQAKLRAEGSDVLLESYVYDVDGEKVKEADVASMIPPSVLQQITADIVAAKRLPTAEAILKRWRANGSPRTLTKP